MRVLKKTALLLFVGGVVLLALIMGGMRLVVSNIDYFESEIAYLLERDVSPGIVFNRVSGTMRGFNPILAIENVSINLPDRSQPLFIDRLDAEFDFWASLRQRAPVLHEISGKLEKVELTRDASGQWRLDEYALGGGNAELPAFAQFLVFVPRYLNLDLRRLIIHDQRNDTAHQLRRVSARIDHRDERYFSQVSVALPDELGRGLLLKSIIDRDSNLVYANGSNLQLSALARLFDFDMRGLKDGALDGEVWVDMTGFDISRIKGDLVLKRAVVQVADDKTPLEIDYHGRFHADIDSLGWYVNNAVERLLIDGRNVPGFRAQVRIPGGATGNRLSARVDRLPLSSLPVVAGQWLPNELNSQIAQGRLRGLLQEILFQMDFSRPEAFRLAARVSALGSDRFDRFPGVTNLNADFVMGDGRLSAKLDGKNVSVDFGDHFEAPLLIDTLSLDAVAKRQASGDFLISANNINLQNQDIRALGRMRLETAPGSPPFVFMRASLSDAVGSSAGKYLPRRVLPPKTLEWLDRGIVGGFVPEGDFQFHGRLRRIRDLVEQRSGEFFVDFRIENADIDFAPGWLHAKNGSGRVLFHNASLEFDIEKGSYGTLDDVSARGGIADFYQAALDLAITAEAPTGDALEAFVGTPVGERYRPVLANLQDFGGSIGTAVSMRLPLSRKVQEKREVHVEVDFKDAAAREPNWGLDLSQITGRMEISENNVVANNVSARFYGDPVTIDIDSRNPAVNTSVRAQGNIETANLLRRLPDYLAANLRGTSDWLLRLDVAGDAAPADRPMLRINASSDLERTRIDLPAPFRKQADASLRMTTEIDFYPQAIRFASRLGNDLRLRGALRDEGVREFSLESLDIAFATPLRTEQQDGVNLYGRLAELSAEDWLPVLRSSGETEPRLLNSIELEVGRLQVFRREVDGVYFKLRQVDRRFRGTFDGSIVRGKFDLPLEPSAEDPLVIDFADLDIEKLEEPDNFDDIKPSNLPPLRVRVVSLRYHGMPFSDLAFAAQPRDETLEVSSFGMRRGDLLLTGNGFWEYDPVDRSHLSSVNLAMKGSGVGEAIEALGFGNSISSGTIDFSGGFTWPAPLHAFSLENLVGDARMEITDGVLNNVEPGNGRFVGLFSLTALPRRLSLDFSDVLIEGLAFEKISGNYRIENGVLYTRNTRMDGPAAKIKVSGETGILRRDYNQTISVTPKIRQTLPILGAVSAGTTVGWGLLLLQNVFKKVIDDAVEVEYQVTGSWDDPQIELIRAVDENQQELPDRDR